MYNSVKSIGKNYQKLSEDNRDDNLTGDSSGNPTGHNLTGDFKTFSARSFFLFASNYNMIRNGSDILVPCNQISNLILDFLKYESN